MSEYLPSLQQLVLMAGMGIVIYVLWRRSSRRFNRDEDAPKSPLQLSRQDKQRERALSDAPPELTRWQVEMYDTARDLKGEIDTKLAVLQVLTRHANEATARLEQAIERAEKLGLHSSLDPLAAIEAWEQHDQERALPLPVDHHALHPQATLIYTLADQGHDAVGIAAQTGLPLGDIEMTLSLRQRA